MFELSFGPLHKRFRYIDIEFCLSVKRSQLRNQLSINHKRFKRLISKFKIYSKEENVFPRVMLLRANKVLKPRNEVARFSFSVH